jgi:hypothetical protein
MSAQQPKSAAAYLSDLGVAVRDMNQRIDKATTRDDSLVKSLADLADRMTRAQDRATYREYAAFTKERNDAEARDRTRAQADAAQCRALQAEFQDVFAPYGQAPPPAAAGSDPAAYARKLVRFARGYLSRSDERQVPGSATTIGQVAAIDGVDRHMEASAFRAVKDLILKAAEIQAHTPHVSSLPPAGEHEPRYRIDEHGRKSIEWFGRESFLKSMGRPGMRVSRVMDPKRGLVLWGPEFPRVPDRFRS